MLNKLFKSLMVLVAVVGCSVSFYNTAVSIHDGYLVEQHIAKVKPYYALDKEANRTWKLYQINQQALESEREELEEWKVSGLWGNGTEYQEYESLIGIVYLAATLSLLMSLVCVRKYLIWLTSN